MFKDDIYDPIKLSVYFCKIDKETLNIQYCSQSFIRKLLKKLNDGLLEYKNIHYII